MRLITCLILPCWGLLTALPAATGFASSSSLEPLVAQTKAQPAGAAKPEEAAAGASPKSSDPKETADQTLTDTLPASQWQLATSFGWAQVKKDGRSWRASGVSDISLFYRWQGATSRVAASLRYLPLAIAPDLPVAEAYRGVLEAYLLGVRYQFPLGNKLQLWGHLEGGPVLLNLDDQLGLEEPTLAEKSGYLLVWGGGLAWELLPGVELGPKFHVGLGSYQTAEISALASFAF